MRNPCTLLLALALLVGACSHTSKRHTFSDQGNPVPKFNADSAFSFIKAQVDQGARVPNTESHRSTLRLLEKKLQGYAGKRFVGRQSFTQVVYGDTLRLSNLIAVFQPELTDRILLCAHWDSRPRSDQEKVDSLARKPLVGADDGGSGVAVLLEIARLMAATPAPIGVDILLFDGEDYGLPSDLDHYFLGSRYWAQHQPSPSYRPRFGILFDLVGAKEASFYKEGYSMRVAPSLVDGIWSIAEELGYSSVFINQKGAFVADDHVVLNEQLSFPTIDIINHSMDRQGRVIFPEHWHTQDDQLDIIDPSTLKAVGQTVLELMYNRISNEK